MTETVFWDTSAFIALGNADDDLHKRAVEVSETLAEQNASVLTTSAVLTEVANTFSRAAWRPVAYHLLESVRQSVDRALPRWLTSTQPCGSRVGRYSWLVLIKTGD